MSKNNREHPDLADLLCSASILLARYSTLAKRECKAHASRTHYLSNSGDAPNLPSYKCFFLLWNSQVAIVTMDEVFHVLFRILGQFYA